MGVVHIYDDTDGIVENFEGLVVNKPDEYVKAYDAIRSALYSNTGLKVLVRNRFCLEAFRAMQANYGSQNIEIHRYSPMEEFYKLYGISVPDYISSEDIIKSGILKAGDLLMHVPGMEFEAFIMANYFSSLLVFERFPVNDLVNILSSIDFEKMKKSLSIQLVNKVFRRRVGQWKRNAAESWTANIIDSFYANPSKLYDDLCKYLLVAGYPIDIACSIAGSNAYDFSKVKFKDEDYYDESLDYSKLRKEIEIYLNTLDKDFLENEDIRKYIEMVSGRFIEEYYFILKVLENNTGVVEQQIIKQAKDKFKHLEHIITDYDEKLDRIIPPARPSRPQASFDIKDWLEWARNEYLPYRFWMEDNVKNDEEINSYSVLYGDWVYNNYARLISSGEYLVYRAFSMLSSELANNELSLVIIIDNFNYKYSKLLKDYFLKQGFSSTSEKPLLAMLPTVTEVSKGSLFTGEPYSNAKNISYKQEVKKWAGMLGLSMRYLENISELSKIDKKDEDVLILNYLEIDDILHKGQKESALSMRSKIKNELNALSREILAFAKRIGYENKLKVYVMSDHGSTSILSSQENLIDQAYYKGRVEKSDHRYVYVADEDMSKLHSNIDRYCYVIDRNRFGTKENYLIAKKYYRFKETDESFYVHGGITPEEQIVPFIRFERVDVKEEALIITLVSNEFRLSVKSKIQMIIKNPNEYAVQDVEISILNSNVRSDSKSVKYEKFDELSVSKVYMDNIRFVKNEGNEELLLKVTYKFLGKEYEHEYKLPIIVKSVQQNIANFDDIF